MIRGFIRILKIKCIEKINLKERPQNYSFRGPA